MTASHKHTAPVSAIILLVLVALAFSAATANAQRLNWKELDPEFVPEGRDDHMMAFDSDQGYIVMFGGDNAGANTWVWDGETWRDLDITGPAPRRESAMVYDSVRKRIVLFGGFDFVLLNSVTWQLDLETMEWEGQTLEDSPSGRADFAMAFHEGIGLTILYGGDGSESATWAFDGEKWSTLVEEDDGPGLRWGHTMVYDSARERIVMFGGFSPTEGPKDDTWEFDGQQWVEITPAVSPPEMRDHAMVYDSLRDQVILFGGSSGDLEDNRFKNDTWSYPNNPPIPGGTTELIGIIPGESVSIIADIIDYDEDQFDATLFYRTTGDATYQSLPMEPLPTFVESNSYFAIIPGTAVAEPSLEYYISSTDPAGSGLVGFWQSATSPWIVTVSPTGRLQVFIENGPARKNGAQWLVVGQETWNSHTDTIRLAPGQYEIRFSTVEGFTKPERMMVTITPGQKEELTGTYERR